MISSSRHHLVCASDSYPAIRNKIHNSDNNKTKDFIYEVFAVSRIQTEYNEESEYNAVSLLGQHEDAIMWIP